MYDIGTPYTRKPAAPEHGDSGYGGEIECYQGDHSTSTGNSWPYFAMGSWNAGASEIQTGDPFANLLLWDPSASFADVIR